MKAGNIQLSYFSDYGGGSSGYRFKRGEDALKEWLEDNPDIEILCIFCIGSRIVVCHGNR